MSEPISLDPHRTVSPSAASDDGLDTARFWFRNCQENHPKCKSISGTLPTRVIDVRAGGASEAAALYATRGEKGYCEALPMDLLPQNFLDAILVTRNLGLRYLWIDAMCIIQDSKADWEAEAAQMASVFNNAAITISALNSDCSTKGFLGPRDQPRVVLGPGFAAHCRLPGIGVAVLDSPLNNRGWCLQERLLAPALLHFGGGQMYWECRTATFDRLPALAGIASRFRAAGIGGRYMAGHWTEGLEESFFWTSYSGAEGSILTAWERNPGFPTWSWVSVSAQVHFRPADDAIGNEDSLVEVMAVKADRGSNDLTATAVEATVKVRGRVASMYYTERNGIHMRGLKFAGDLESPATVYDLYGDDPLYLRDHSPGDDSPSEGRDLEHHKALVLVDSRRWPRLLVLRQVRTGPGEGGEGEIPVFRRVGSAIYRYNYLEDDELARFEEQVIILE
ncbi:heterokaryon incompatibility protein [Colletotrichum plurivorum]|uniref:Heterokaryon incompatibility protein n=1 Tax=Colletotrichum plurivorum TaxID=2175906 RepID=A0A8H6NLR8_9PEZI|nr:heterokaryon incompatibility protein [Colletotrichum plurivorum]